MSENPIAILAIGAVAALIFGAMFYSVFFGKKD
jgi:hypothetical protein